MRSNSRRGAFLLGALGFASLLPSSGHAVIPFTPEEQYVSLLSSFTAQDVIPVVGGFQMYVTSNNFTIASATSTDQAFWGLQGGIRLSTGMAPGVDASSVTACTVVYITTNPADGLRMYYAGISDAGQYSILSATSTDGLAWSKESGIRLQRNGGVAFLDSPRAMRYSSTLTRLYYVADNAGGNTPTNYRIYSASSPDQGLTFFDEGPVLPSDQAYQVYVTTLTDGRTRLYYSAPFAGPGINLPGQVLSAISSDGLAFQNETGVRLSTDTQTSLTTLTFPVVVRSTETYRWRMFETYSPVGAQPALVSRALTLTPVPTSSRPGSLLVSQNSVPMTITGEIFSPAPTASYVQGTSAMTVGSLVRVDDMNITGVINPLNQSTGRWNLDVTNSDLALGTLANALLLDIPPGSLALVDNLFRPLLGQSCAITIQIFQSGNVSVKIFTMAGGLVNTLFDGPLAPGVTNLAWSGRTAQGNVVASGVYIVRATGPKLDDTQKIVVIK